jgi:hypothetical protein
MSSLGGIDAVHVEPLKLYNGGHGWRFVLTKPPSWEHQAIETAGRLRRARMSGLLEALALRMVH